MSDDNRSGQVLSASVTLLILPSVFVALRMISRYLSKAGIWWDDVTVVIGMILSWGANIINLLASRDSLGHHKDELQHQQTVLVTFFKYLYAFEVLYSVSMAFVKFSVILFQYRIFPVRSFRRILSAYAVFVIAFETASTLVFIFDCTPIRDFWINLGGYKPQNGAKCVNLLKFWLINGSINTVTDFGLLLLPLPMLWRLRASTLQKYILTGIFITGLTVTAVSMVRLVVIKDYQIEDYTYNFVPLFIWTAAEPSSAIVSACLPSLRPLIARIIRGSARGSNPTQDGFFRPSSKTASTWRGGSKPHDGNFCRLPESGTGIWSNNVAVYGGMTVQENEEEALELRITREEETETPVNRIRAKTTVTLMISDRVDWRDDLF